MGLIPESGRYPGEGNGNTLQYSFWEILWTEEPGRHGWAHAHACHQGMTMTNVKILPGKWSDVKLKVSWLKRTELHNNGD